MNENEADDSDELVHVREMIGDLVSKWVQEAKTIQSNNLQWDNQNHNNPQYNNQKYNNLQTAGPKPISYSSFSLAK